MSTRCTTAIHHQLLGNTCKDVAEAAVKGGGYYLIPAVWVQQHTPSSSAPTSTQPLPWSCCPSWWWRLSWPHPCLLLSSTPVMIIPVTSVRMGLNWSNRLASSCLTAMGHGLTVKTSATILWEQHWRPSQVKCNKNISLASILQLFESLTLYNTMFCGRGLYFLLLPHNKVFVSGASTSNPIFFQNVSLI